jgi:hypothetical protein
MLTLSCQQLLASDPSYDLFPEGRTVSSDLLLRGLYTPLPVAYEDGRDPRVTLIWGWNLVREAVARGIQELFVVPNACDSEDSLLIALAIENRPDGYTMSERAAIYARATSDGLTGGALDRIGLAVATDGSFASVAARYLALSPLMREAVDGKLLDLKSAEYAERLPASLATELLGSACFGRLSFSRRRVAARLLCEIAVREPEQAPGILSSALEQDAPDQYLSARRYPDLSAMRRQFDEISESVRRRSGVRLHAPEYFEGADFRIEFTIRSCTDLDARRDGLGLLEEHCDELFSLLR